MTDESASDPGHGLFPALEAELAAEGFEEVSEIGHGGFGVVFRCREPSLDRTVAVKVLNSTFDEDGYARFLREQRAMGQLSGHPNIVNVLRIGATASGRQFLVMQYHARGSLETVLRRRGPLAWSAALQVGVKLAGALETAHRAGILHRDIKPGNVLVTGYGEPQLSDFGIARIAGGFETDTGTITGSPAFTAPEVLSGDPPTVASDVYGLGATLFCLLTGHAAFERRSGEQIVAQFLRIAAEAAPPLPAAGIPADVRAAVESAMARAPGRRPATAAEFGHQLRAIERSHGLTAAEMALPRDSHPEVPDRPPRSDTGTANYVPTELGRRAGVEGPPRQPPSASTKYRPPTPSRALVARGRLAERLHGAGRRRLILIHAPAGFGKSTLAAQWQHLQAGAGVEVAWLSIDADDNNVVWFLSHLIESIRLVRPDLAEELGQILEDHGEEADRFVLTALIDEIHTSRDPLTVVVDDWHLVNDPATIAAMSFLLDHGCHHLQVVVTSRSQSGLPLGRMRVRDELVEIDSTELRFDEEESRQFLVDVGGLTLDRHAISALRNSTEGWVAALQLATLSLRGRDDPAEFIAHLSGRHRGIAGYLAENVLSALEPEILDFMLATSVTERLCADLAETLAGVTDGQGMLEQIEERDLFLRALDDDREWFRYHHLFADFLRRRLQRDQPTRIADLHRTASRWFAANELLSEAVDQSLAGGDPGHAAELVDSRGFALIERSQMATALGLIGKLPSDQIERRPRLQIAAAWAHILLHHRPTIVDGALDSVRAGLAVLPETGTATAALRAEASLVQAAADLFRDRIDELTELISDCLAREKTLRPFALAGSANVASYEAIHRFDFEAAIRWQEWAAPFHARTSGPFSVIYGYCLSGLAESELLNVQEAEHFYRKAYDLARGSGGHRSYTTRLAGTMLGESLYEQGHLDDAERLLDECSELGSEGGVVDFMLVTYGTGSRIKALRGDLAAAARRLDEGTRIATSLSLPRLAARIENERTRWRIAPGLYPPSMTMVRDPSGAAAPAADPVNGVTEMTAELDEDSAIRRLLVGEDPGDAGQAHRRAEKLVARAAALHRPRAALRARLLHVVTTRRVLGDPDALTALVPLLAQCSRLGLIRPVCDEGPALTQLVATLVERHERQDWDTGWPAVPVPFLRAVLASSDATSPPPHAPD
ncbi:MULTISPECIES: serine/threonine-protein kinase [unclassified Rhodococcus (in: high G+C Gram-positive bacteria)]|uniref:serine/threonine-protein kinase n=1 Tax=unclassified Rhodococcus (in: high G+C Gram-positive bacteria) TaxID=192944 RepID=UPI00163A5B09|nr:MULTISPECIES: serine/threonine-protein kinase [unclassified Rhodococcus (in: high G+C Gram-positive bacteria)]MBC2637875.1 protein kinase [Rhodococcus sp. 3A]MBC2897377.1 protein kinase [Rhodococcus sp. 4CII]